MHPRLALFLTTLVTSMICGGCGRSDQRLVDLSQENAKRQAEQNRAMAAQSQEIANAAHKLIEADAQARQEIIELQTDLQRQSQIERRNLDRQHEVLENERRQIAQQRHRDPVIAAAILNAAIFLACLSPLLLAWLVLRAIRSEPTEVALGDLLVNEMVADEPLLMPASLSHPRRLEHQAGQSMPEPSAGDRRR